MDTVLIIVAVVAVVLVVGGLLYRRRGATAVERDAPEVPKKISAEKGSPGAEPVTRERSPETPSEPAERPSGPAAPEPVTETEAAAEPEPEETEEDVRERVQTLVADSERMLGELREASGGEGEEGGADGGVEIMAEGLEEVKALADQERWSQARTKGEALYSQLSHMLQDVRRQQTS